MRLRLLERGFKAIPPPEDGEEPEPDLEIEEDPEEFDREAHERDLLRQILETHKGLAIDGNWTNLPNEEEYKDPIPQTQL